ncbi:MAG TPA: HEAT repeat domain-containing protein [Terriglobales bacterium]|nr:HEAT repeat domain-containing protein [Terriglobales bacterium]
MKYVRLYGFDHKRTDGQFEMAWKELQTGLPTTGEGGFLLGVTGNKLLLDGIPLDTGQAERSFAQLLTAAGLASIHFSAQVTKEDFSRLVRAFASSGSKAQDFAQQIKEALGDSKRSSIKINEVKFVAADPTTGEVSVAAQIAAQTLGPEFKQWLNDPQKLLQLIAAAEGAHSGGSPGGSSGPIGSAPMGSGGGGTGTGSGGTGTGGGGGTGPAGPGGPGTTVPLQEEEVIQAIRLLTHFGRITQDPNARPDDIQKELVKTDPNAKVNLQQLLEGLAASVPDEGDDTPLLMKAAEHMAIRFALERYQKGEVKVNAVHQMLEHMSRQMDTLRQILRIQEEKMNKAGILVESHADILDRMFWAEVPEAGKRSVLMSNEAPCVPARNVRQFLEQLIERGDTESVDKILRNYFSCLGAKDAELRRKTATGLSQLADLYAAAGGDVMSATIRRVAESLTKEQDNELQSLLCAAFVRLSQESTNRRRYGAIAEVLGAMEIVAKHRPSLAKDMEPRIGIENRIPEFIDDAMHVTEAPPELMLVLRRSSQASIEHLADRFFRCMQRDECDRLVELVKDMGAGGLQQMRETLRTGQPRQAAAVVGLMSRLDVPSLLELLPGRLPEWNRFYHDVVVRQIAFGAAVDRGHTLLELLEILDPLVLPQAVDEIGMSGDQSAAPALIVMAEPGEAQARSPLVQLKAIESLGRLRVPDAVPVLRNIVEAKKMWKFTHHREMRVAAAQALSKTDPRYSSQVVSDNDLDSNEIAIAPLDSTQRTNWVRQRRYERFVLPKSYSALLSSSWGKSNMLIRELSLGGGMGTKEDNLRIGSEANIEISVGMRKIRGQVLLRRARVNEVGFEIVNTDLESRYRLRHVLVEAMQHTTQFKSNDWDGQRKT